MRITAITQQHLKRIIITFGEYAQNLRTDLQSAYELVRRKGRTQGRLHDVQVHGKPYKVGNIVWLHTPVVKRGESKKLHNPWTGPFEVIRCCTSDCVYKIRAQQGRVIKIVHLDHLKPCTI